MAERLSERRFRAGHPAGLGRASPVSGRKLQAAVSVLCSTTWLQKLQKLKWHLVWGRRIQRMHETNVKAQYSSSGGLWPYRNLPKQL